MKLKRTALILFAAAFSATFLMSGCAANPDAVIATYGDDGELKYAVAEFALKYDQSIYDTYFGTYQYDDFYHGDGYFTEESIKEETEENLQHYCLASYYASEYDVELTDDEKDEIADVAKEFIEANSEETLSEMGARQEVVEEYLTLVTVHKKVSDAMGEEVDTYVDPEESKQRTFSYIYQTIETSDSSSDSSVSSSEVDETQLAEMEEIAAAAQEDFDAAAEAYDLTIVTYSYGADYDEDEDGFDANVIEAADELSEGEVSGVITGNASYFIIRLDSEDDPDAREDKEEEIISERQDEHYEEVMEEWQEEANFTLNSGLWAKITIDSYFVDAGTTDTTDEVSTDTSETDETQSTLSSETDETAETTSTLSAETEETGSTDSGETAE